MLKVLCLMVGIFVSQIDAQQKIEICSMHDVISLQLSVLHKVHPVAYAYLMLHCLDSSEEKYSIPAYWGNNQLEILRDFGFLTKPTPLIQEGIYIGLEEKVQDAVRDFVIDEYEKSPVIQDLIKKLRKVLNSYFMVFIDLPIE